MIVQGLGGALQAVTPVPPLDGTTLTNYGRLSPLDAANAATYGLIWRTQPNVRTVVDFIARNVAQIGLHAFRRVSDLDRERLAYHETLLWLDKPGPGVTRYGLFYALMHDLGVYMNAYWLKSRRSDGAVGLTRLPPEQMTVQGWLVPTGYTWTLPDGRVVQLPRESVVYFGGYDTCDPLMGLSPLETLRRLLAEDAAQTNYRAGYWQNASRMEGIITRPATAPKWTTDQKQTFRDQWVSRFGGGAGAGQTAVLEDGMDFKPLSFSARDSEFVAARKLTAEEVTRAYHVPLPMVGILDHATFSNVKEQHKHLYQDCLGPWLRMITEVLEAQLLVDAKDTDRVYLEFNIADKLQGSFEEQAGALQTLVGRPVMSVNEARARLNLPRITDDPSTDAIALPLNTATTGAAPAPEPPDPDAQRLLAPPDAARIEALIAQLEKAAA